jgi:hypothetical protein
MEGKPNIGARITLDGEKEYRQAIGNVSKSMTVLKSELKAVSSEFDGNANSLDALRAKNEIYTKQQSEQEKKLALLRGALDGVTKEYGENSKQAQDWKIKLNNAYSELTKINRELNENEKYMREAENSTDKTAKSIDEFGKEVKNTKEETLKFGDVLKANLAGDAIIQGVKSLFNAIRDGGRALVDVVKESAAYADNIMTMSTQTGIATDTLQELNYMAELTDTSLETITATMARNVRSMNSAKQGTELYVDAYRQLGLEVTDTNGQLKDSGAVFWSAIDALGKMANETERDALAMQLFGRSAQDLNPLIEVGSQKVAEFAKEARDMGAVLSTETLQGLGQTDDALQRLSQQFEISKRKVAVEMAPAVTEALGKITDKIGDADDEFADFAGGALEDVVDSLIWVVDNADLLISGLKGIGTAIIAKKASDGIVFAINAYQTLTTTTQAATAAQTAFNVASKANVIGAIASAVIGLGAALYTYTQSANEATKTTEETISAFDKLNESIQKNKETREENLKSIKDEYGAIQSLNDKLYDLAEAEKKTNSEKQEMAVLVEQLNKAMPDLNLTIDEQTGLLGKQRDEVDKLITSSLKYAEVQAAQETLSEIAKEKYQTEQSINDMYAERIEKEKEYSKLYETWSEVIDLGNKGYVWLTKSEKEFYNANKNVGDSAMAVSQRIRELNTDIEAAENQVSELGETWNETTKYIRDNSALDAAGNAIDRLTNKLQGALETQSEAEITSVEDRIQAVNDLYDDEYKDLEKRQRAEEKAFEKSQQAQVDAVEKAQDKELEVLEKSHQKKLKLIDEEYLEKMKNVDEDRYKELKSVQDEIDGINAQQKAEDEVLRLRQEADKKAELQAKISTASTVEDRLAAQKELTDYEEELARDRLKNERELQVDILETQKDTINDTYDAKIDSLKEAQEKEKEATDLAYENEKDAIDERYRLKMEALKEEQELEKESLNDKQAEYKEYLADKKDLAIQNAKDIYEEDLTELKLLNALKYDEVKASEEKIKKLLQSYATTTGLETMNRDLANSNVVENRYGNIPQYGSNVPSKIEMDYTQMETALVSAFKKANLAIMVNDKVVGTLVENKVNRMLK